MKTSSFLHHPLSKDIEAESSLFFVAGIVLLLTTTIVYLYAALQ